MAAEIERQIGLLEAGEPVLQETLHYDPAGRDARPLARRRRLDDYRYFPEPDLAPLEPSAEDVERLRGGLPELPGARIARFRDDLGLGGARRRRPERDARDRRVLRGRRRGGRRSKGGVGLGAKPAGSGGERAGRPARRADRADLGRARSPPRSQSRSTRCSRPSPAPLRPSSSSATGSATVGDSSELDALVAQVMDANPALVEQFRGGKDGVINALVGQVMKETRGRADARQVQELLRSRL